MTFFERKRVRDKLQHNQIEPAKEGNAIDITANRRETKYLSMEKATIPLLQKTVRLLFGVEQRFEMFCKSNIKFV